MTDQDQDEVQLPKGYEDSNPVVQLPKGYEDSKPIAASTSKSSETDPRALPPPGIPRPTVNVRPISMGEVLGLVSGKDVENAEKHGMQHYATDQEVDQAATRNRANFTPAQNDALKMADTGGGVGMMNGFAKSATSGVAGASRLAQRAKTATQKAIGMDVTDPRTKTQIVEGVKPTDIGIFGEHITPEETAPNNAWEGVGNVGENSLEYLLGSELLKAVPGVGKLLSAGSKANLPLRMVTSGAENALLSGAQDYIHSGGDADSAIRSAEIGGGIGVAAEPVSAAFGGIKTGLGKSADYLGSRFGQETTKDLSRGTDTFIRSILAPNEIPPTGGVIASPPYEEGTPIRINLPQSETAPVSMVKPTPPVKFVKSAMSPDFMHVSMEDPEGNLAGFAQYKINNGVAKITSTNVAENLKGNGLGKKMYIETAQQAASDGATALMSDDNISNDAARTWKSLMKDNPGSITEQNGKFRWDLSKSANTQSGLNFGAPKGGTTPHAAEPYELNAPVDKDLPEFPDSYYSDGEKSLKKIGNTERNKDLLALGAKAAAYGAVDYGLQKIMDNTSYVKDSPKLQTWITLGVLAAEGTNMRKNFAGAIKANPALLKGAAKAASSGQSAAKWVEAIANSKPAVGTVTRGIKSITDDKSDDDHVELPAGYENSTPVKK